jgi:hypothetical protein
MLSTIPTGTVHRQHDRAFRLLSGGHLCRVLWPRRIERQVASAKITREEGDAKLKKVRPWFGYFPIA